MPPEDPAPDEGLQPTQPAGELSVADFETGGEPAGGQPPPSEQAVASPPAETQPLTIRDAAQQLGFSFGPQAPQDDYTALAQLVNQARQAQQLSEQLRQADVYRQLGQHLAPKAQQLGQFLQQQEAPKPRPYEPPPFDKRWAELVERDPRTGVFVSKPNVPPAVAEAANAWADWQSRFMENPAEVLRPLIEDRAGEIARQVIHQEMGQYQQQQTIFRLAQANADWAYTKDAQGRFVTDPATGQWQLTPAGSHYVALVRDLAQMGVADPVHRDQLARQLVSQQLAAQPPAAPSEAPKRQEQALGKGRPNRNPLQALSSLEREQNPLADEPDRKTLSMRDRLSRAFEEENITDKDFQAANAFYGA
jgi:hypothetical protein